MRNHKQNSNRGGKNTQGVCSREIHRFPRQVWRALRGSQTTGRRGIAIQVATRTHYVSLTPAGPPNDNFKFKAPHGRHPTAAHARQCRTYRQGLGRQRTSRVARLGRLLETKRPPGLGRWTRALQDLRSYQHPWFLRACGASLTRDLRVVRWLAVMPCAMECTFECFFATLIWGRGGVIAQGVPIRRFPLVT